MNRKSAIRTLVAVITGDLFGISPVLNVCFVFALCIGLTGCTNKHPQSNPTPVADTIVTLESPAPHQIERANISPDSLASFLLKANEVNVNKKGSRPFSKLDYNRVIAYDYECGMETRVNIVEDGRLNPAIKQQVALTQRQVDELTNYLGARSTYGESPADCFNPHLGIVFYRDTSVVAFVSICLDCHHLESSIEIPVLSHNKSNYLSSGFSDLGKQKLTALCAQLNFSHCKY